MARQLGNFVCLVEACQGSADKATVADNSFAKGSDYLSYCMQASLTENTKTKR